MLKKKERKKQEGEGGYRKKIIQINDRKTRRAGKRILIGEEVGGGSAASASLPLAMLNMVSFYCTSPQHEE